MKYIFFLGRIPAISLAEIQALLEKSKLSYEVALLNPAFVILDVKENFYVRDLFVQMGGTLKIAKVLGTYQEEELRDRIVSSVKKSMEEKPSKKSIGYSIYFTKKEEKNKESIVAEDFRDMFSKMKRDELGDFSTRIVYPEGSNIELSTASVFNNKLTNPNKGIEFDFIFNGRTVILAKTLIVQDIESYSMRDYEKPGRDAKIGMMPPKLALMLPLTSSLYAGAVSPMPTLPPGVFKQRGSVLSPV